VLNNAGPEADTYTLSVSNADGWEVGNLPPTITLGGLEQESLNLEVTPPSAVGEIAPLTITAVSQADPGIVAEITVNVAVGYPQNAEGCYVVALEGSPFEGEALLIPLTHPAVKPCSQGGGVHIDISEWAEYEGISDAAGYEIHGTDEGDEITGSVAKDTVYGYGGDDYLEGSDEDVLDGGTGDNTVIRTQNAVPGDADGSGTVDMADAILTLQVLTGSPADGIRTAADLSGDLKIGTEELVHILREISE
jgi:hypothetical protein